MTVKIKICGLTRVEEALAAAEAGADAIGLMFYEPSPRCVDLETAAAIAAALPPFVSRVGVFVDPEEGRVREVLERCRIDRLQFHGEESPEFCRQFGLPVIKAVRVRDESALAELAAYDREAWLLDSYVKGVPGGTGEVFNWDLAVRAVALGRPVLLAGGLTPDNAAEAVRQVRPYGLDVSSGVEAAPGRKDADKVRAFIRAARGAY